MCVCVKVNRLQVTAVLECRISAVFEDDIITVPSKCTIY